MGKTQQTVAFKWLRLAYFSIPTNKQNKLLA